MQKVKKTTKYTLYENLVLELSGDKQTHKQVLQSIRDLLTGNHMRAIFFEDVKKACCVNNRFNILIKEFEKFDIPTILKNINYTESPAILFMIYSSMDSSGTSLALTMKDLNAFERHISSTAPNASIFSSAMQIDKGLSKYKLVLLY